MDNPKIAVAVVVENGGFGATYAAPIASLIVEKYLNDTIATKRLPIEQRMKETNLLSKYGVQINKSAGMNAAVDGEE
jgi:penicillin-binding protein 2